MQLSGQSVAITGATGFLGAHLALAFQAAGAHVRAVVRTPAKAQWLADAGASVHRADLSEPDALRAGFEGCDIVVANAARITAAGGTAQECMRDNRDGVRNQLLAAAKAGVQRVVSISTMAVYATRPFQRLDETAPLRDPDCRPTDIGAYTSSPDYARSKTAGELLAWPLARDRGLELTMLRPGPIYGPGWSRLNQRYRDWHKQRLVVAPTVRFPHVHVADCAEAAVRAVLAPSAGGRAYNLGGPLASPYGVLGALKKQTGTGPHRVPLVVPVWLGVDDTRVEQLLMRPLRRIQDHTAHLLSDDIDTDEVRALYASLQGAA